MMITPQFFNFFTFIVIIVTVLILYRDYNTEYFQYFKDYKTNLYNPYAFIDVSKDNTAFTLTDSTYDKAFCQNLCEITPRCSGYNFFQNSCTLYKNTHNLNNNKLNDTQFYYRNW